MNHGCYEHLVQVQVQIGLSFYFTNINMAPCSMHMCMCVCARTCVCAYVEGAHTQTAHACKEQCNSFIIIIEKWKLTKMTNRTEKKNIKQFRATTNRSSFQLSILRIKEGKKRGKIQLWEDHLNATKRLIVLEKKKCWQGTNNLHITIILQLWGR